MEEDWAAGFLRKEKKEKKHKEKQRKDEQNEEEEPQKPPEEPEDLQMLKCLAQNRSPKCQGQHCINPDGHTTIALALRHV